MARKPEWSRLRRRETIKPWATVVLAVVWKIVERAGDIDFLVSAWQRWGPTDLSLFLFEWGWLPVFLAGIAWLARVVTHDKGSPIPLDHRVQQVREWRKMVGTAYRLYKGSNRTAESLLSERGAWFELCALMDQDALEAFREADNFPDRSKQLKFLSRIENAQYGPLPDSLRILSFEIDRLERSWGLLD